MFSIYGYSGDGNRLLLRTGRIADEPGHVDLTGENPDGSPELYLYDIPTETYTQITDSFGANFRESNYLSYNGDRILFVSDGNLTGDNSEGDPHLFLYDYPTDTLTQISPADESSRQDLNFMHFSPDESRVFFHRGNAAYLYDIPTDSIVIRLPFGRQEGGENFASIGLMTNGNLFISENRLSKGKFWEYDIATGNLRELFDHTSYSSPSFTGLAVLLNEELKPTLVVGNEIFVRDTSTDTLTQVTQNGVFPTIVRPPGVPLTNIPRKDSPPFYSRQMAIDGHMLFARSDRPRYFFLSRYPERASQEIFLFDAETAILTQLTDSRLAPLKGKKLDFEYVSPDGNVLIFTGSWDSGGDGKHDRTDVFRYDVSTKTLTTLFSRGSTPLGNRRGSPSRILSPDSMFLEVGAPLGVGDNVFFPERENMLYSLYRATCSATGSVTHPPAAPAAPQVRAGNGQLTVTWSAPANNGSALEDYTVQWKESSFSRYFWEGLDVGRTDLSASATTYTITGLDNDTAYQVRVRATNAGGWGDWSAATSGTPGTVTAQTPRFGTGTYSATLVVGTPVNLTLPAATGGDGALRYSLSPLPAGLSFNSRTRVLSGTPTTAQAATSATYTVTDSATPTPGTATRTYTITVLPEGTDPPSEGILAEGGGGSGGGAVCTTAFSSCGKAAYHAIAEGTGATGGWCHLWGGGTSQAAADQSALSGCPSWCSCRITGQWEGPSCVARADAPQQERYAWAASADQTQAESRAIERCRQSGSDTGALALSLGPGPYSATLIVGKPVNLTLPAATGGVGTLHYSLSPLPAGLTFTSQTRILSGTPTTAQAATAATYTVTDSATPTPATDTRPYTLTILPANAKAPGAFENPTDQSAQSGIGVLSGWVCEATSVEFEIKGVRHVASYGMERLDTASTCGDTLNGFGMLYNWNRLGDGTHTVRLLVDGQEYATATVQVTTLGEEFRRGLQKEVVLENFPQDGQASRLVWQEAQQNFVLAAGPGGGTGSHRDTTKAMLENPAPGSYQSGVRVFSGWVCEATDVVLEVDGVYRLSAGYGTERAATASGCGDTNNGFGLLFNWSRLSDGPHTVRLLVDGEVYAQATFAVTTLGEEFRRGLVRQQTIADFPGPGQSVIVEWQEAQQNFVITAVQ